MTTPQPLLTSVTVGAYTLPNRVVMAPLTRNRAGEGNAPTAMNAVYYRQRATAGLIISEATQISPQGMGYPGTPGIYSAEQIAGWKQVTDAVHERGGRIFLQLWHVGRISHPSLQPNGELPVAPSAIAPDGMAATYDGMQPFVTPRALETEELPGLIAAYRQAAENAQAAGFDGVEVHSANGYLLDQFLQDGSNQRTDQYGGSIENRARLLFEVLDAVVDVWGGDRVGIRLSPSGTFNDMVDSDPQSLFTYVISRLNPYNLAYLHLIEPRTGEDSQNPAHDKAVMLTSEYFRTVYTGIILAASGYTQDTGNGAIAQNHADLVAFGRLYISNPDLVDRFAHNAPLNPYDRDTFYGGNEAGYIDYPTLTEQVA
ncbi:MAG: alkene reductase [Kaiparowitsia implicata GSE-PSE-MK54-09C]|jgi:N-ethylmaleimide reductase|nr:alkene reductase [Kaiparowitsia implicata GSE-PSE-MK54-09C]